MQSLLAHTLAVVTFSVLIMTMFGVRQHGQEQAMEVTANYATTRQALAFAEMLESDIANALSDDVSASGQTPWVKLNGHGVTREFLFATMEEDPATGGMREVVVRYRLVATGKTVGTRPTYLAYRDAREPDGSFPPHSRGGGAVPLIDFGVILRDASGAEEDHGVLDAEEVTFVFQAATPETLRSLTQGHEIPHVVRYAATLRPTNLQ